MAADRARLEEAAMTALTVPTHYARQGRNLAWAALAGAKSCVELQHYPRHDLVDAASGTRFFYHAHATSPLPGRSPASPSLPEHGHFHLFTSDGKDFDHLAALSLDAQGRPVRWFTTNQWVTGERWSGAAQWSKRLNHFEIHAKGRLAPVARWLTAMVFLYRQELAELLEARDMRLNDELATRKRQAVWNDQRLHIMSQIPISLEAKVQALLGTSSISKESSC